MPKTSWFRRLVRFFAAEQPTAAERARGEGFPRLYPSRLEDRQVLDGVPLVQIDAQGVVAVSAGAGANDGRADTFEATRVETADGAFLRIQVNDQTAAEFRMDDVRQLVVEGSTDADTLVLDANAVPIGGVEFIGEGFATTGLATGGPAAGGTAPGTTGADRLLLQGSPPTAGGATPSAGTFDRLVFQVDAHAATLSSGDGAWTVATRDVERIVDSLPANEREVYVGAGLDATLRGDAATPGWTTVEVAAGPALDFRNSLVGLSVTATNVHVAGRVDLQGASVRLVADESLVVGAAGELASRGGAIELSAPQLDVQGLVDVGTGSVRLDAGPVGLLTLGGELRASGMNVGERGGTVELRGDFVRLLSTARIDATGNAGGGVVLVGSGGNVSVDPLVGSRGVWIELGAVVDASATRAGDGGRIVAWGTEGIVVDGLLAARGGAESGDGGFVETSTVGRFSLTAAPVLTAPHGRGGEWLIDPRDLEIVSGAGSAGFVATGSTPSFTFTSDSTHNQLSVATLLATMGAGVTVELKTGTGGPANGDITLSTDLDYNGKGAGTLKLTADGSIILNGRIYDSVAASPDSLTVVLTAGSAGASSVNANVATQGGAFTFVGGDLTIGAAATVTTSPVLPGPSGQISLTTNAANKTISVLGGLNAGSGAITLVADAVNLGGAANSIQSTGAITLQPLTPSVGIGLGGAAGAFNLTTSELDTLANGFSQITIGRANGTGGINLSAVTFRDPVVLQSPSAGTINVDGTLTGTGDASILIDGAGATTVLSANVVTSGTPITFADNVQVDAAVIVDTTNGGSVPAGANVTFAGTVDATAAVTLETLQVRAGTAGDVTFSGAAGSSQALDSLSVTGDVVSFASSTAVAGPLAVTSQGTTTFSGAVTTTTVNGNVTLTNGGLLTTTSAASITASGTVVQNGAGAVSLGANITTASGAISFASAVTVTGPLTISSVGSGTGAAVTFSSTVDATLLGTPESLVVNAGTTGDVTFTGAVGGSQPLDSLAVTGRAVLFSAGVSTTGAISVTSATTTTFTGPVTTTAAGGNITLTNGGLLTIPSGAPITAGGSFTQNGAGAVTLGANVLTASGAIAFASPVTIVAAVVVNSTNGGGTGGNVTFSGAVDATAAPTPESLQVIAGSAGDVTFSGAVGASEPLDSLDVSGDVLLFSAAVATTGAITLASAGTMTLNGSLATTAAGGDITLTNSGALTVGSGATITSAGKVTQNGTGAVSLAADVTTPSQEISFQGPVVIKAAVLVDSTVGGGPGADVTFGADVDATAAVTPESLVVDAGTAGDVTFSGDVGSARPLDSLDVTGDAVSFVGTVDVAGPLAVVSSGALSFGAAVTTTTASGTVVLTNGGLLTVASGATFTTSRSFTQNGAGDVSLGDDVLTDDGAISFASPVQLTQSVTLSTTNGGGSGADITLADDVSGTSAAESLTLDAGTAGDLQAQALGVGAGGQRLGGLVILGADDATISSIATAGGMTSTSNTLVVTGAIESSGAPVAITVNHSGPGAALQLDAVDVHGRDLTISSAGSVQFTGGAESIRSTTPAGGRLTLQGTTAATTIGLGTGAAGAMQLDDASIDAIGPGFTTGIMFGRGAQTGTITLRGPNHSYDQNVTIRATGGATVDVGATLDTLEGGADGKSITISGAAGVSGSSILLGGDLLTDGGNISIVGKTLAVQGPGVRAIVTSGLGGTAASAGDVDLADVGQILGDGTSGLRIDARRGAVGDAAANDGQVDLSARVGSTTVGQELRSLDVRTDLGSTVLASSAGTSTIQIRGTAGTTGLFLNGSVQLRGDATMTVTPGDADLREAVFSTRGIAAKSLTVSTVDGGAGADGVTWFGETDATGGKRLQNVTITTSDGGAPGMLVFDHPGVTPLDIDIIGAFTHAGVRVIVADDVNLSTSGGAISLAGSIDASTVGVALRLDAAGGNVSTGPIGSFGGGAYLSEVRLLTSGTGEVTLDDPITIDDPAGTGAGVVIQGRTRVAANVTIRTEAGNDDAAAPIDLSGATVFADVAGRTLVLDAHGGAQAGGDVSLGAVGDGGSDAYLQHLRVDTSGTPSGTMRLADDVLLDDSAGTASSFEFLGGDVIVTSDVTVDTEQGGTAPGGAIDWGTSAVSASVANRVLRLDARGLVDGGTVEFGTVAAASGGRYLAGLRVFTNGAGEIQPAGDVTVNATNGTVVDRGVLLEGNVRTLVPGGTWAVRTQPIDDVTSPINLSGATLYAQFPNTDLSLDTSVATDAGAVSLGGFEPGAGASRIRNVTIKADGGSDDGDVTFTDPAQIDGTLNIQTARNVAVQQNVTAPVAISMLATGAIAGAGTLTTGDLTLVAGTGIHGAVPANPLHVITPNLDARSTVSGDVRILNTFAGPVTVDALQAVAGGNVAYQQSGGGLLTVAGTVSTVNGNVAINTDGPIVLGGSSVISTVGGGTNIAVNAGGALTLTPGGVIRVGTGAANPGRVEHVPPAVSVSSPLVDGSNVDGEGNVTVDVDIGDAVPPVETGFDVTINWGDGAATTPNVNGPSASFSHQYVENPGPDATSPIPITVTVDIDPRITLTQNGGTDVTRTSVEFVLQVAGTFFGFIQLTPSAPTPTPRVVTPLLFAPPAAVQNPIVVVARHAESRSVSVAPPPVQERQLLLRVVLPDDPTRKEANFIESELSYDELNDLSALFERLPDGRYQIWLKLEDGSRQLFKDCYVRDGKAIDLEDLGLEPGIPEPAEEPRGMSAPRGPGERREGDAERGAPRRKSLRGPADPLEEANETPEDERAPAGEPSLRGPSSREESAREARGDWSERARDALAATDERAFSKARRLLRRGSA